MLQKQISKIVNITFFKKAILKIQIHSIDFQNIVIFLHFI